MFHVSLFSFSFLGGTRPHASGTARRILLLLLFLLLVRALFYSLSLIMAKKKGERGRGPTVWVSNDG
jgi:hypothetical protein